MKLLITHSYPEKNKAFTSDEVNYIFKNHKDWKVVSFSKIKENNPNIISINVLDGIKAYLFSNKINLKKKIKILKLVFSFNIKENIRNFYSLFLTFSLIERIDIDEIEYTFSYWLTRPTIIAYYLNYLTKIEYYVQGHGSDIYIYPPINIKNILKKAKKIITISNANKNYIQKKFNVNEDKIKVLRLGANPPQGLELKNYLKRENKLVYIGRLEKVKGIDILLESLKEIKDELSKSEYKIEIYGSGTLEKYARNFLIDNDMMDFVFLKGWISQEEIYEILNNSKGILLSSYSEGLPVILMQAASQGTPIIATDVGGVNEIVYENKNGFLCKNINSKDFSKSILDFLKNPKKEDFVEKNIKIYKEKFELNKNLEKKYNFFSEGEI